MRTSVATLGCLLLLFLASIGTACAKKIPKGTVPAHSTIYVVPSDAAARFAHFIQHPPVGMGRLRKEALQIVPTPAEASYSVACKPVWQKKHDAVVNHLVGGYMPGWSALEVRQLPAGNLVFYKEMDTGGGTDKRRDDMAARICVAELTRLTKSATN